MPCAAPVRSSETVSPIIFCRPISTIATDTECKVWTPKKPITPSPSGQISGKAIQRTMEPMPAISITLTTDTEAKIRLKNKNMQTSATTPQAHSRPMTEPLMPIDFQ